MKTIHIALLACTLAFFHSCKKENLTEDPYLATINLVNAIASNSSQIKMNFTGRDFIYATSKNLHYYGYDGTYVNGAMTYAIAADRNTPLIITPATDTTKPLFNQTLSIGKGDSYTLFATGYENEPSVLLVQDTLAMRTDSTGIRIVNLSPNSDKVIINIYSDNYSRQISNIQYKTVTPFISFPAETQDQYYIVEVRKADTDEWLTEFFLDQVSRQKNITLIVRGLVYDSPAFEVVRLNH